MCGWTLKARRKCGVQRIVRIGNSLEIMNSGLRWFGYPECKDNTDEIRHCTTVKVNELENMCKEDTIG